MSDNRAASDQAMSASPEDIRSSIIEEANGLINLVAKVAPVLGAGFLMIYATDEGFFPRLVEAINIPMMAFLGIISIFVLCLGLAIGSVFSYWAVAVIAWHDERAHSHLLPKRRIDRWVLFLLSFLLFLAVFSISILRVLKLHDDSTIATFLYFFTASFAILPAFDLVSVSLRFRTATCLMITFLGLAILHHTSPHVFALPMQSMGFRSQPDALIFVDDDAHNTLLEQSQEAGLTLDFQQVHSIGKKRWRLYHATVVWMGVGKSVFLRHSMSFETQPPTLTIPAEDISVLSSARVDPYSRIPGQRQ